MTDHETRLQIVAQEDRAAHFHQNTCRTRLRQAVRDAATDGWTDARIADAAGVTSQSVRNWLGKNPNRPLTDSDSG